MKNSSTHDDEEKKQECLSDMFFSEKCLDGIYQENERNQ